ncbi:MAG: hypothetical protein ACYCT1_03335 [Steroidobacteraceae bacterium]
MSETAVKATTRADEPVAIVDRQWAIGFGRAQTTVPMAVLLALKKPRGIVGTPSEVWLPKKISVGLWP